VIEVLILHNCAGS